MLALAGHVAFDLNEPMMFWGQPGCGKSEGIAQLAKIRGALLVDIRLSQYDSVDLRGIPVPQDNGLTVWNAPATLPFKGNDAFPDEQPIVLFLDEINSAANAVAAVAYQLINDRRVGEHVLKDNVTVIAAGNRDGDRGVTNRMPTPLANRFTHAEVMVDADAWCEWAATQGLPSEGIAFIQFRKPLLSTFDPAKPDKAFATPRTWSKALKYFQSKMPEDVKQAAIAGAIGEGPAAEFWGFIDIYQNIPSIESIRKAPTKVDVPEEPAMRYAVAVAISSHLDDELAVYLDRMDPEFGVLAWKLAFARDPKLAALKSFMAFAAKNRSLFS